MGAYHQEKHQSTVSVGDRKDVPISTKQAKKNTTIDKPNLIQDNVSVVLNGVYVSEDLYV